MMVSSIFIVEKVHVPIDFFRVGLGDSGGPLMINYHSPHSVYAKLVQVGVISYGPKQCGESGLPGVYTRITEFRRWILDNLI